MELHKEMSRGAPQQFGGAKLGVSGVVTLFAAHHTSSVKLYPRMEKVVQKLALKGEFGWVHKRRS